VGANPGRSKDDWVVSDLRNIELDQLTVVANLQLERCHVEAKVTLRSVAVVTFNRDGVRSLDERDTKSVSILNVNERALRAVVDHSVRPFTRLAKQELSRDDKMLVDSGICRVGADRKYGVPRFVRKKR
jgi:hypothetical protein